MAHASIGALRSSRQTAEHHGLAVGLACGRPACCGVCVHVTSCGVCVHVTSCVSLYQWRMAPPRHHTRAGWQETCSIIIHACAWYKGNDGFICMGEPSTGAAALITAPPAPSLIGAARH